MEDLEQGSRHWELVYQRLKYWSASLSDFSAPPAMEKHQTYMQENFVLNYMTIWTDICNDSFPSTIQYWRLIETHKPSCNQAYSSKTKLSSPLLVRPPFELGSWKAERRKTLPFSSKLHLLAQIARLWPLWGCNFAVYFFLSYFIFSCQLLKSKLIANIWFWHAVPLS